MRKQYSFLLLIILFTLTNCKRDNGASPQVFTVASYPLAIGSWWQYQVNQSAGGGGYDTIMLSVISVSTSSPYVDYLCNITLNGMVIDSGNFYQSDTSLSFINNLPSPYYSLFPNFHLKFPVSTGQYWQGEFSGDSIRVVGVTDSCQGAYGHNLGSCFSTVESYNLPHNFKVSDMLLTPNIGLVRQSIDFRSDTAEVNGIAGVQVSQSIALINYHLQ